MGDEFNLDKWIISMSHRVEIRPTHAQTVKQRIEKIPTLLRNDKHNEQEYEPKVVSLGPYHHKKPELQLAEKFKEESLEIYCLANKKMIFNLSSMVRRQIPYVRSCYVEGSTDEYSDDEFTKMMVLDGCFILNFVNSTVSLLISESKQFSEPSDLQEGPPSPRDLQDTPLPFRDLEETPPQNIEIAESYQRCLGGLGWANTFCDMFLLENQIPYRVLEILGARVESINKFINFTVHRRINSEQAITGSPLHLLEIYRNCFLSRTGTDMIREKDSCKNPKLTKYTHSFRSVMELKQNGVHFRPSSSTSLTDIKFKSFAFYGQLELPCRLITSSTKAILLNLIAYEMCPYTLNDYCVTSYVGFMKSLINDSNDVKELRSKHILLNKLESDVQLAKMFEEISIPTVNNRIFEGVKETIQEHYTNKAKTMMAELISRYFSSPWSTTALLAAILLLVLTFLQTFFTIFPKYSNK